VLTILSLESTGLTIVVLGNSLFHVDTHWCERTTYMCNVCCISLIYWINIDSDFAPLLNSSSVSGFICTRRNNIVCRSTKEINTWSEGGLTLWNLGHCDIWSLWYRVPTWIVKHWGM